MPTHGCSGRLCKRTSFGCEEREDFLLSGDKGNLEGYEELEMKRYENDNKLKFDSELEDQMISFLDVK
jgi:hypothetical protein